jgi:hypothetical protein
MSKISCAAAAALLLTTMRTSAHHAFAAEYDENKFITVSGTVTTFKWANPHAWLYVDAKDEHGSVTSWGFEMASPNGLLHRGWKKTELQKGDQVTVEGMAQRTAATWLTHAPLRCQTAISYSEASNQRPVPPSNSRRSCFSRTAPIIVNRYIASLSSQTSFSRQRMRLATTRQTDLLPVGR